MLAIVRLLLATESIAETALHVDAAPLAQPLILFNRCIRHRPYFLPHFSQAAWIICYSPLRANQSDVVSDSPQRWLSPSNSRNHMAKPNLQRRQQSLVDPEVQGSLLRKLVLHWTIFFVANTLALMIWLRMFEQPESGWGQTFLDSLRRFLPFYIVSLALVPAFLWDTMKLTNRFAGPILRLRGALADAARGQTVKPLKFRGSDFWQEIATNFNTVICSSSASAAGNTNRAADADKQ